MTWQDLEQKYQIKFTTSDNAFVPVNIWLDDIYLTFSKEKLDMLLQDIFNHSELFEDLTENRKRN